MAITMTDTQMEASRRLIDVCTRSEHTVPWAEVFDFIREEQLPEDVATSILAHCKMEGLA